MGIFGDMFDLNRDGKMDAIEEAAEFSFFMNMVDSLERENDSDEDGESPEE